jgi:hypothetical protein
VGIGLLILGVPSVATINQPYSFTPSLSGGKGTKVFALTGSLPAGLVFNTSTGAITGTPTATGTTIGLLVSVTDDSGSAVLPIAALYVAQMLAPTFASFTANDPQDTIISNITGLAPGETIISFTPNDGRLEFIFGNQFAVGPVSSPSAGSINAVINTSGGRSLSVALTINAQVLGTLSLSGILVNGAASSGTIIGASGTSQLSSTVPGLTINSPARTYVFDGTAAASSYTIVETLTGATNSPNTTPIVVSSNSSGMTPPTGYIYLTDLDNAYLKDADGAYLMEAL